jgi:hypothetical protein
LKFIKEAITDICKARQTKDGLCANCKACKHQQKIANKEKNKKEKENTEKSCDTE